MAKKQIEEEEKKETKQITVKELPKQEVRKFVGEDDIEYEMFTREERMDQLHDKIDKLTEAITS